MSLSEQWHAVPARMNQLKIEFGDRHFQGLQDIEFAVIDKAADV